MAVLHGGLAPEQECLGSLFGGAEDTGVLEQAGMVVLPMSGPSTAGQRLSRNSSAACGGDPGSEAWREEMARG